MSWEQWPVLTPTTPLPNGGSLPPVYHWLAAHPDGGAVADFPVIVGLRDPPRDDAHVLTRASTATRC